MKFGLFLKHKRFDHDGEVGVGVDNSKAGRPQLHDHVGPLDFVMIAVVNLMFHNQMLTRD